MTLTVEKQGEFVKAIKAEYTPAEALTINHAMRRYACDEEVNKKDRDIIERMLEVEPIFTDFEHKAEIVISQLRADRDRLQEAVEKIRAEIEQEYNRLSATRDETLELGECLGLKMSLKIIDKYKAESEET